jgi:glycyl-tRNA synthetase
MTQMRDDVVGLEATIIMHPKIWEASGHVETFADMMVECPITKKRYRADQIEPQVGVVYRYTGAADESVLQKAIDGVFGSADSCERKEFEKQLDTTKRADALAEHPDPKIRDLARQIQSRVVESSGVVQCPEPFEVLVPQGKPAESARKTAKLFYQLKGVADPKLEGETAIKLEQPTTAFSPDSGAKLSQPRPFNLMFKTHYGPIESDENIAYLRPETAQAIFVQFKNVLETSRQKVPFGIAQIGKAFRNEVTPRNYTFRSREFEQMELEFFIKPDEVVEKIAGPVVKLDASTDLSMPQPNWGWEVWHKYWVEQRIRWYESIGLPRTVFEEYWQKKEELAHYAKATVDILYKFPFGTQELEGIAARGDFDLSQHQKFSGKSMEVFDEEAKAKGAKANYIPHVIEPSAGVDRLILALICNAYCEDQAPDEKGKMETRVVLKFHPRVAPYKVAVFPLLKNRPELVKKALEVRDLLRPHMTVFYDEAGAIGRRYRRQDEAGTPFGVTIDFDTLGEKGPELKDTVTLRDRDSMKQERVAIGELLPRLLERIR